MCSIFYPQDGKSALIFIFYKISENIFLTIPTCSLMQVTHWGKSYLKSSHNNILHSYSNIAKMLVLYCNKFRLEVDIEGSARHLPGEFVSRQRIVKQHSVMKLPSLCFQPLVNLLKIFYLETVLCFHFCETSVDPEVQTASRGMLRGILIKSENK